jgi:hypothetical protein
MLLLKPILLSLLFKLFFGFFLNTGFLFERSVLMSELSLSFFFKATQVITHSILICYKIVLAYKTKKEYLWDLYS